MSIAVPPTGTYPSDQIENQVVVGWRQKLMTAAHSTHPAVNTPGGNIRHPQ